MTPGLGPATRAAAPFASSHASQDHLFAVGDVPNGGVRSDVPNVGADER